MPDVHVVSVRVRQQGKRVTVKRVAIYAADNYGDDAEVLTTPEARDLIRDLEAAIQEAEA
jgi:hypothetical protein